MKVAPFCKNDAIITKYTTLDEVEQVSLRSIYSYILANGWSVEYE